MLPIESHSSVCLLRCYTTRKVLRTELFETENYEVHRVSAKFLSANRRSSRPKCCILFDDIWF